MLLKGKVALVTGAGRGLGRAHALALAAAGAQVMVNDLGGSATGELPSADAGPGQLVADEISAAGGIARGDQSDIASWSGAARLVERTVDAFGGLDIIVNNAGICRPTAFGNLAEEDWDRIIDVNAKGMAALIDAAARHWISVGPRSGRAIICTSSPGGANPTMPLGIYGVSKAAVLAIAQIAAQELATLGVRVNALAPIARTRMLSAAMGGRKDIESIMPSDPDYDLYLPDHVARLVLYLVSPLCPFTGRLFGARADDLYIYDGWTAPHFVSNGAKNWTIEAMAAALADLPLQEHPLVIGPKGRHPMPFPPDHALASLQGVAQST